MELLQKPTRKSKNDSREHFTINCFAQWLKSFQIFQICHIFQIHYTYEIHSSDVHRWFCLKYSNFFIKFLRTNSFIYLVLRTRFTSRWLVLFFFWGEWRLGSQVFTWHVTISDYTGFSKVVFIFLEEGNSEQYFSLKKKTLLLCLVGLILKRFD